MRKRKDQSIALGWYEQFADGKCLVHRISRGRVYIEEMTISECKKRGLVPHSEWKGDPDEEN